MCVNCGVNSCNSCGTQDVVRIPGLQGTNGQGIAIKKSILSVGDSRCPNGGTLIEFAKDFDNTGVYVDANKITELVNCNNASGVDGVDGKNGRGLARFQQAMEPTNADVVTKYSNVPGFGINPAEPDALNLQIGDVWALE